MNQSNLATKNIPFKKFGSKAILGIAAVIAVFSSVYTVEEGHIGIVKRFGEAKEQTPPGLHMKIPFVDSIEEIEVRTRINSESMPSSTKEQMPVTTQVSVNWTVQRESVLDLFKKYGGLAQFESRILDPRFRTSVKEALPKFTAEQLIQDRAEAITRIEQNLLVEMESFPVSVDNVQIENIQLPQKYIQSIEIKQTELNLAQAEKNKLERQRYESLQAVNTAEAEAQAIKLRAQAEAEATKLRGEAEAHAIEVKAKALANNPLIIQLTEAQKWDGRLPATMMGSDTGVVPLFNVNPKD